MCEMLQRDAIVGHAEAIRSQSRKPSKAHTHTRNASLPTQANHTVRGARKQPPKVTKDLNVGAIGTMYTVKNHIPKRAAPAGYRTLDELPGARRPPS